MEESLAISICCLAVEGKLDLITPFDFQQSMNFLLCSSRRSPRLLALLRFFAGLFDREYGGDLSKALNFFFSTNESDSREVPGFSIESDSDSRSSGRSSPSLPHTALEEEVLLDSADEDCLPKKDRAAFDSESESDQRLSTRVSSLRPSDIMICSLGPCQCCKGTVMAHIRAISCAGCSNDYRGASKHINSEAQRKKPFNKHSMLNKRQLNKSKIDIDKKLNVRTPSFRAFVQTPLPERPKHALEMLSPDVESPEMLRGDDDEGCFDDLSPTPLSLLKDARDLVNRMRVRALFLLL